MHASKILGCISRGARFECTRRFVATLGNGRQPQTHSHKALAGQSHIDFSMPDAEVIEVFTEQDLLLGTRICEGNFFACSVTN